MREENFRPSFAHFDCSSFCFLYWLYNSDDGQCLFLQLRAQEAFKYAKDVGTSLPLRNPVKEVIDKSFNEQNDVRWNAPMSLVQLKHPENTEN